ncbi:unnamed protein product [Heterobilharzia americana]|nr:unnamed protein product [Heterobilharzia americana]
MKEDFKCIHCPRKVWKWIFHLFTFILCIILLVYRTSEWLKSYNLLIDHKVSGLTDYFQISNLNKLKINNNDYDKNNLISNNIGNQQNATIILCNINPIRLSNLFTLPNGSDIYTHLITKYGKIEISNLLDETDLTQDQIKEMAHPISSTLKSCQYGDDQCSTVDFVPIFTSHGWCYQYNLNYSRTAELKLILDPQEYDYIIPNKGYVGFYLIVQNGNCINQQSGDLSDYDQSVIIGPKFHSFINIQQQNSFKKGNQLGSNNEDLCSTFHIQSVVQLEKLPIQIHLLQKFNVNLFRRNGTAVQLGILYQQKAFLQIYNRTAYNLIKDLSKELYIAKKLASFASEHVWKMYKYLERFNRQSDQTKLSQNYKCYTQVYNLLTSLGKDVLSKNTLLTPSDEELQLINSFFETKVIVSPSSTLLRKILTVVMKFRYLLSNMSLISTTYQRNTSLLSTTDLLIENPQLSTVTTMNCSHLITYHEVQISKGGEAASAALTRLDHVNTELHNLIRNNHLARLIFPKSTYPYTELYTSSMVSMSIRLSKFEIPQFYGTSTLYADMYLKNLLLTIFISTLSLYLALFIIVEFCTVKQTISTNHICTKYCQPTNQKQEQYYHSIHHDTCIPAHQCNQLTSFELLSSNNYQTCDYHQYYSGSSSRNDGNYLKSTGCSHHNDYEDNPKTNNTNSSPKLLTTHEYGHNNVHNYTVNQVHPCQNKASTFHTSSVIYECDNSCHRKACMNDTSEKHIPIFPTHGRKLSVENLETINDSNLATAFLLTPKITHTLNPTTSSSKYYLHHPANFRWNIINQIQ